MEKVSIRVVPYDFHFLIIAGTPQKGFTGKVYFEPGNTIVNVENYQGSRNYEAIMSNSRDLGIPVDVCESIIKANKGKAILIVNGPTMKITWNGDEYKIHREISLQDVLKHGKVIQSANHVVVYLLGIEKKLPKIVIMNPQMKGILTEEDALTYAYEQYKNPIE